MSRPEKQTEKAETKLPLRKNRNFLKEPQLQILTIMHNMPHVAEKNSNCRRPLSSLIFKVAAVISSFHPRDRRQVLEEIDGKSKSTERGGAAIQEKPD